MMLLSRNLLYFSSTVPTGPPQSVVAQVVDPTVFTLTWSPPVPERRNGLIQRYIVSVTELDSRTTELFNSTVERISITGRLPFRRYSYTVAAVTIGQGPFSVASIIHLPQAGMYTIVWGLKLLTHASIPGLKYHGV